MYIVIELQTSEQGTVGNFVWSFSDQNQAFSKYHSVLASAAVSSVAIHSCVILRNDGLQIAAQSYKHIEEPAPEPNAD